MLLYMHTRTLLPSQGWSLDIIIIIILMYCYTKCMSIAPNHVIISLILNYLKSDNSDNVLSLDYNKHYRLLEKVLILFRNWWHVQEQQL